jgi:hypothetical protein
MYEALRLAWYTQFGDANPKHESLLVLLAQWNIETAEGARMHNWNVGNVKSIAGDGLPYTFFDNVWEGLPKAQAEKLIARGEAVLSKNPSHAAAVGPNKVAVIFKAGHPQTRFRAFASLDEGVEKYLQIMSERFALAWPAVLAGDPVAFVAQLAARGYFTADAVKYTQAVVLRMNRYKKTIKQGEEIV